ncbi:MAG: hypothetical protein ACI934_002282, partial [Pseudohongiellaceae bacterium]
QRLFNNNLRFITQINSDDNFGVSGHDILLLDVFIIIR